MNALLLAAALATSTQGATVPGVTVWVWHLAKPLPRFPLVVEGQVPNAYFVSPLAELKDGVPSQEGILKDQFAGQMHGELLSPVDGVYRFKVEADDGGRLSIGGKPVCDTEANEGSENRFTASGQAALKKGANELLFRFYEDGGNFHARILWMPPGTQEFVPIPAQNLRTQAGQTFVVNPGPKSFELDKPLFAPGDGRPLVGVHPAFRLENFRGPQFEPHVGGLCFVPDGRLAVCTWDPDGAVYLLDLRKDPATVQKFASGLGEPLGIAYVDGSLVVTQKGEVTRLRDLDGDDVCDSYEVVASGWPTSHNYHEFTFNLVPFAGKYHVTTSVPLRGGWTGYMPGSTGDFPVSHGPGSWIEIDPKSGSWKRLATGLRTPNGMNIGIDGEMFCSDNQGSWLPASRLNWLRRDGFYGHQETRAGNKPSDPPVVWFPHGEIGNSPSEPVLVSDGPYRGQMLVGDVTHGGIKRIFVEKVDGTYQGCVFRFSQGIEAGVNRLVWGPDGCLYVGGIGSNGNWNHLNHQIGLQRLRPGGPLPFEIHRVEAVKGGFKVTFTKKVDPASLERFTVDQFWYEPKEFYGGPKLDLTVLPVKTRVEGSVVHVSSAGFLPGHVVHFRFAGIKDTSGQPAWATEAWYTLNKLSPRPETGTLQQPLEPKPDAGMQPLRFGPQGDFAGAGGSPFDWLLIPDGAEVKPGTGDLRSKQAYGDLRLHVEWMAPPGGSADPQTHGNSGIKLMGRYEVQVLGLPLQTDPATAVKSDLAGAVYGVAAPKVNASFGPGVWQTYDLEFTAPRWQGATKTKDATITLWWNGVLIHDRLVVPKQTGASQPESPGEHPFVLQNHASSAEGGVRFRNIRVSRL